MARSTAWLASLALAVGLLTGCGGQSEYCKSVEASQKSLNSFGKDRTDEAFAGYATTLGSIAKQAPSTSKENWQALADATQSVITAHEDVGFALEDMGDEQAREGLSEGDIGVLNEAYAAFNDTAEHRKAIIADVQETCDIELK